MNNSMDIKYNSLYYYFIVNFYVDNDYKLVKAELELASKDYLPINTTTHNKELPNNVLNDDILQGFINFENFQDAVDCVSEINNKLTYKEVVDKYFTDTEQK